MSDTQNKNLLVAKVGKSALLIFLGVILGVSGILLVSLQHQPSKKEMEEIKKQYEVDFIQAEQQKLGYDCHGLRGNLKNFLNEDILPALTALKQGRKWNKVISDDTRKKMGELQHVYFACGRLYSVAQNAQWNGLDDLDYSVRLDNEIITLNTYVRFGEPSENCSSSCTEKMRSEIQSSMEKIERLLEKSMGSKSMGSVSTDPQE